MYWRLWITLLKGNLGFTYIHGTAAIGLLLFDIHYTVKRTPDSQLWGVNMNLFKLDYHWVSRTTGETVYYSVVDKLLGMRDWQFMPSEVAWQRAIGEQTVWVQRGWLANTRPVFFKLLYRLGWCKTGFRIRAHVGVLGASVDSYHTGEPTITELHRLVNEKRLTLDELSRMANASAGI